MRVPNSYHHYSTPNFAKETTPPTPKAHPRFNLFKPSNHEAIADILLSNKFKKVSRSPNKYRCRDVV